MPSRSASPGRHPPRRQRLITQQSPERLAQLRDDGVISPEDFEAKKRQILGI